MRPFPFYIIECTQDIFTTWTSFFNKQYKKNWPMKIGDIRELLLTKVLRELLPAARPTIVLGNHTSLLRNAVEQKLEVARLVHIQEYFH